MTEQRTAWFDTLTVRHVPRVGGKNASLGEMVRTLKDKGVRVPDGFATTAAAFREYVAVNGIEAELRERIEALKSGKASLHETGESIRRLFLDSEFPEPIAEEIREAYRELSRRGEQREISVAVRSNATAEDLPQASFAGQQETFLNVRGERAPASGRTAPWRCDGFSIGSNDLTQLVLGVDRDSGELAPLFDERNEAVKRAVRQAIARAHAAGIKIGICGQAPSNYPEFAAFLVEEGIDSISLNPDSFVATMRRVAEEEERLGAATAPRTGEAVR